MSLFGGGLESSTHKGGKSTNPVDCPNCGFRFWISDTAKHTVGSVTCPKCGHGTTNK